ncbi:Protein Y9C9A.5 [Aphelenchoides avenae]|nr:Protein Y9C9A.5 [Aphelenchus avenae]
MNNVSILMASDLPHFGNLRPLRYVSERICFAMSMTCNTVLAWLLIREKDRVMKPYSRVLLINCLFDYLYTIGCFIIEIVGEMRYSPELEIDDGNYIFIINGLPKNWSREAQQLSAAGFVFLCSLAGYVAPIEFTFRYMLVVKNRLLKAWELTAMSLFVVLLGIVSGSFIYLTCDAVPDHNATFGHLMSHPMWMNEDGTVPPYFGLDRSNSFLKAFVAIVMVCDTMIVVVIVTTSLVTLKVLRRLRHQMTERTRYLQKQLNRLMLAEVISLLAVIVVPFAIAMWCLILRVQYVGFGILMIIIVTWIPTVNPMTTIILVGPYRNALFGRFRVRKNNYATDKSNSIGDMTNAAFSMPSQYPPLNEGQT